MRQIGFLEEPAHAKQFAAYLITQGVAAHAEPDNGKWAVWVRDENQVESAKDELIRFRQDPQAAHYQSAQREAETIKRNEERKREKARKNLVQMSNRWGSGSARRTPVVFALIAISVGVVLATNVGHDRRGLMQYLLFEPTPTVAEFNAGRPAIPTAILRGQVWRLVTPMFIHLGWMHLIFNMIWLYVLGRQIEGRLGSLRFLLFALALSAAADLGQYWWQIYFEQSYGVFGGMSGVVYGLFGFVWIKTLYFGAQGYRLSSFDAAIMFGWFFACILGEIPATAQIMPNMFRNVANMAHAVGLIGGVLVAYAPLLLKPPRRG